VIPELVNGNGVGDPSGRPFLDSSKHSTTTLQAFKVETLSHF
jgi:hypothetical protein